ncbi:hypothetical protein [Embleya hyalina]|uniref:Uncharacterized protein n=1 Tax=Embleya hyalina TaxID=516124 RepID=A0A401YKB6_9ACTN|nr:hypothetical protein [Embleya hyalina]GCD95072.1 hypothetical protein EHYA_02741 [Embleya hyalina]
MPNTPRYALHQDVWEIQQPLTYDHRSTEPDPKDRGPLRRLVAYATASVLSMRLWLDRFLPGGPRYGRVYGRPRRRPRVPD